jgi:hypothetical protein
MAFFYSLSIECGQDHAKALQCANHFEGWKLPIAGVLSNCEVGVSVQKDSGTEPAWWVVVIPAGVSQSGVWSVDVAQSMSAAGRSLLERLKTAPPFRFAMIGIEAQEAVSFNDLGVQFAFDPGLEEHCHGLVVSEDVYDQLGRSPKFEPFSQGRFWIPYRGETYAGS